MDHNWNRKDKTPQETIKLIKTILKDNGIRTRITSETEYNQLWYSNRIEFEEMEGKGTNGKGISKEFALASGYAEFMERLQSRMLFDGLFANKDIKMEEIPDVDDNSLCHLYIDVFKNYFGRNNIYDIKDVKKIVKAKNGEYSVLRKYYDFINKEVIFLPERFILSICGSNGLCSGNTKYEAFCQGLCEVFERYVNYKIYHEPKLILPIIERKKYEKLYSYEMIRALEKKGYNVYVKDCTLNGKFPVLGVLVINHNMSKYYFRLGSDMNMDICIQRCITEMFQGLDINSTFRLQLNEIDDCEYDGFWNLRNMKEEYFKTVLTGDGKLPRNIFLNPKTKNENLTPFIKEKISNKEMADRLSKLVMKSKLKIYIKDYSYLGFNTLCVYIPGISEIIDYNFGVAHLQDVFNQIKKEMYATDVNIEKLNILLKKVSLEKLISANCTINDLLGLHINKRFHGLLNNNVFFFIAWLNVLLKNPTECEKWLNKYHYITKMNQRDSRMEMILFQALIESIPQDILLEYYKEIVTDNEFEKIKEKVSFYYNLYQKEISWENCDNCKKCKMYEYCSYPFVKKLKDNINKKYMEYEQAYDYTDEFYNL